MPYQMYFHNKFYETLKMFQFLIKILQITNFHEVNIDSDNFIYTLFAEIASVYM